MMRKLAVYLFSLMIIMTPLLAEAQNNPCTRAGIRPGPDKLSTLPMCINQIYVWSLGLGALLALLMTVMGGYLYMTAAGNAEQSSKAKEYIWGSVIGLALLFTAFLLLRTINPDLTNFNTSSLQKLQRERNTPAPTTTAPIRGTSNPNCVNPDGTETFEGVAGGC